MMWNLAALALLPLMAVNSPVRVYGIPIPWGQKLRTWAGLVGAACAAWFYVMAFGYSPDAAAAFFVIDAAAAWLVLRHPVGIAQKTIGLLFVGMLFLDLGFFLACQFRAGGHDLAGYVGFNRLLGWLQLAVLMSWGLYDAIGYRVRDWWGHRYSRHLADGV